jgi:proline racemase
MRPDHGQTAVSTVDYHAAGEPFRIVTGGVEPIAGSTMLEKRRFAQDRLDGVRRLLVNEPRGHADMYGGFVTEPVEPGSDLGVLFFHNAGFSTACGHGTIALATWAVETGAVEPKEQFRIDVPSGTLDVEVSLSHGRVKRVSFRNVPSFVLLEGVRAGAVTADVAFGGAFYASVDAATLDLAVEPSNVPRFIELELSGLYGVIFFQRDPGGDPFRHRNVTVFADGEVDRSPCGSGTSARLAILDRAGELPRGQTLLHSSVIETEFEARVVGDAAVGSLPAVLTEVSGSAYPTGFHEFVLDPSDPLGDGFLLR